MVSVVAWGVTTITSLSSSSLSSFAAIWRAADFGFDMETQRSSSPNWREYSGHKTTFESGGGRELLACLLVHTQYNGTKKVFFCCHLEQLCLVVFRQRRSNFRHETPPMSCMYYYLYDIHSCLSFRVHGIRLHFPQLKAYICLNQGKPVSLIMILYHKPW